MIINILNQESSLLLLKESESWKVTFRDILEITSMAEYLSIKNTKLSPHYQTKSTQHYSLSLISRLKPMKGLPIYIIHNSFLLLSACIFNWGQLICPYFGWFTSGPQRAQSFHQLHITIYPTEAGWTLYGRVHMKGAEIDFWLYWSMDPLVPLWAVAFQLFLEPN